MIIWAIKIIRTAGAISSKQNCLRYKSLQRVGISFEGFELVRKPLKTHAFWALQAQKQPEIWCGSTILIPLEAIKNKISAAIRPRFSLNLRRNGDFFLPADSITFSCVFPDRPLWVCQLPFPGSLYDTSDMIGNKSMHETSFESYSWDLLDAEQVTGIHSVKIQLHLCLKKAKGKPKIKMLEACMGICYNKHVR